MDRSQSFEHTPGWISISLSRASNNDRRNSRQSESPIQPIMSEAPVTILATGRTDAIGRQVIALMKPEYESGWSPVILSLISPQFRFKPADRGGRSNSFHIRKFHHRGAPLPSDRGRTTKAFQHAGQRELVLAPSGAPHRRCLPGQGCRRGGQACQEYRRGDGDPVAED